MNMAVKLLFNNILGGDTVQMQKGTITVSEETKTLTIPAKNCTNLMLCCANSSYTTRFYFALFYTDLIKIGIASNSNGSYLSNISTTPNAPIFSEDSITFTITGSEVFQPADYNWQAW